MRSRRCRLACSARRASRRRCSKGRPVSRVEVRVGHLRQVVPDSLRFAFELITAGTVLEGAELALEEVPARVRCIACEAETELEEFPAHCGECGGLDVEVTAGEELLVDSIDVEDGSEAWQRQVA